MNIDSNEGNSVTKIEDIQTEVKVSTGKGKGKRAAFRKRIESQCLKVIDRKYKQKRELLPGIITYSEPIAGEIDFKLVFQAELIYKVIKRSLEFWAHGVGYSEIRSLKGLNGQSSATSDLEAINETARRLTLSTWVLINEITVKPNFTLNLMERGFSYISLPTLVFDLVVMANDYNKLHQHNFLDKSSIKLNIKELTRASLFNTWKEMDEDFGRTFEKFLEWEGDFDIAYNYLSRFTAVSNFMASREIDIFELSKMHSNHTMNSVVSSFSKDTLEVILGQSSTEKDIALNALLTPFIVNNCLKSGQLHTYTYKMPTRQLINALKRFVLREYVGIEDNFVAPVTTNVEQNIQVSVMEGTETIV